MDRILITGVSTGIGHSMTEYLINKGFFVFGSVREAKDAGRLKENFGSNFHPLIFDVRDDIAISAAVEEVERLLQGKNLFGLINNAGIAVAGPSQFVPVEKWRRQFEVNVFGVVNVIQAFLPLLGGTKENSGPAGRIVNISSVSGRITSPFMGPYSSSKFALEALSNALRRELFVYGIKVIVVQPGPIKTPIFSKQKQAEVPYRNSVYAPIMKKWNEILDRSVAGAIDPIHVSRKVHLALTGSNPKTRYLVTKKAWQIRLLTGIPTRWLDYFMKKRVGKALEAEGEFSIQKVRGL